MASLTPEPDQKEVASSSEEPFKSKHRLSFNSGSLFRGKKASPSPPAPENPDMARPSASNGPRSPNQPLAGQKSPGAEQSAGSSGFFTETFEKWWKGKPLACLEEGPFAFYLDEKELTAFAKIFKRSKLKQGEVLVKQGDDATDFYVVEEGELSVEIEKPGGNAFLGKKVDGDMIGEKVLTMEWDAPYKRTASVVAIQKTKVMSCTRKDLHSFLKKQKQVREVMERVVTSKTTTLKSLSLLEGAVLSDLQIDRLGTLFRHRIIPQGSVIFQEGQFGSEMFVVSQGNVEIATTKKDDPGQRVVLATFGPGQFFGELALAMNMPRSATAVATEKTLVLSLEKGDLLRFLTVAPDLQKAFDKQVAKRITNYLRRFDVPFLNGFNDEQYEKLAESCKFVNIPADVEIFKEGDEGREFCMIIHGEVKVTVGGREVTRMKPGSYFGEIALVQNTKRTATVTSTTDCLLLVCEKENFEKVFASMPWVMADFQAHLAPEDMTIEHVITHKTALRYFTQQLEKEFSEENLKFVKAAYDYKQIPDGDPKQLAKARAIMDKYIIEDAEIPVNVPSQINKDVQRAVSEGKVDNTLFNLCLDHILHLMATDSLARFKKGPLFEEFVDSLNRYHGVSKEVKKSAHAAYAKDMTLII
eukprot:comp17751_c1_seq1/m.17748 comp17751_c1_seq1/g.17748  ORF comp17751_c1_seq1/g.17748 comp17751_c1_seq1/m.17748 type:complete len:642 (-) comp17751_c1_seq1:249-2174(-)